MVKRDGNFLKDRMLIIPRPQLHIQVRNQNENEAEELDNREAEPDKTQLASRCVIGGRPSLEESTSAR